MCLLPRATLHSDSEQLPAGKNVTALSDNGLKMTSVHCPLNVNKLKCLSTVQTLTVH
jgi:hypothetical protein